MLSAYSRFGSIVLLVAGIAGCAMQLQPTGERVASETHRQLKNYAIGQEQTVNVGDPMIKYEDYWITTTEAPVVVPSGPVRLDGGLVHIALNGGQKYPVRGTITLDGGTYTVVGTAEGPGVLINADGSLHNRVVARTSGNAYVQVAYTMNISDPSVRFKRETLQHVETTKGYENYELLYTGQTTGALNITYREFSPEGLARVAFFQNLTYAPDSKTITFKKYRIAIDKVSSEAITYRVLQDGH